MTVDVSQKVVAQLRLLWYTVLSSGDGPLVPAMVIYKNRRNREGFGHRRAGGGTAFGARPTDGVCKRLSKTKHVCVKQEPSNRYNSPTSSIMLQVQFLKSKFFSTYISRTDTDFFIVPHMVEVMRGLISKHFSVSSHEEYIGCDGDIE